MASPAEDQSARGVAISVVMPVLNEEQAIASALRSVLSQDVDDMEVLVVDGASEDRTREIVTAMAAEDPRVRLLHNPQRSIPHALNVGLAAAQGEFLARFDGHCQLGPGYLRRAVAHLRDNPGLGGVGGLKISTATTARGRAIALALSSPFGVGNSIIHYGNEETLTDHAASPVYRTQIVRQIGGWDPQLAVNEDVDLDFRVLQHGATILFDPKMSFEWFTPETLRRFGRQYRRYGRGKAEMVRKNGPQAVRARHLVAPALVIALAGAGVAAVSGRPRVAALVVAPYAAGLALASLKVARGIPPEADVDRPALPAAFATMHVAWGLGFLEGLAGAKPALSTST